MVIIIKNFHVLKHVTKLLFISTFLKNQTFHALFWSLFFDSGLGEIEKLSRKCKRLKYEIKILTFACNSWRYLLSLRSLRCFKHLIVASSLNLYHDYPNYNTFGFLLSRVYTDLYINCLYIISKIKYRWPHLYIKT